MRMYVTGMGMVCGLGDSTTEIFQRLCAGEHVFRELDRFPTEPYAQQQGGALTPELEEKLRDQFPDDDLAMAMIVDAGKQALHQAGEKDNDQQRPKKRAMVLATNFAAMEALEWAWRERIDTGKMGEETFLLFDALPGAAAQELGCTATVVQTSMSCASGAAAVAVAQDLLATGRAEQVLVVAYDDLSEFCWCGLSNLRTITTDLMRPFDVKRSGTIFSEGAAAMLLEACPANQDAVLATIAGVATGNNAFHLTAPPQEAEGSGQVMSAALAQAGLSPDDIDHVCAHATSTVANDATEAAALRNLFGERLSQLTVAAHKSQLGHLMGGAGLAEAVITVLAMQNKLIPPTINVTEMDPKCQPIDCVIGNARTREVTASVTNSAGIGGNNAAMMLLKGHQPSIKTPSEERLNVDHVCILQAGWVLPADIGSGDALFQNLSWLDYVPGGNDQLAGFSPKPYLQSVKGYLDPGGAMLLAAARLAMPASSDAGGHDSRRGICTATRFGSMGSGYTFFTQMSAKGPRAASPMIFPHGYANTPGNLAAIEFGYAGPHMVFYGSQNWRTAFDFAAARLVDGTAEEMLLGFYESAPAAALPDGWEVLHGAVVLRLGLKTDNKGAWQLPMNDQNEWEKADSTAGAVNALRQVLKNARQIVD